MASNTSQISSSTSSAQPEFKDDAVYNEGDMTIWSSDEVPVRFRLPSFYLLGASAVIRDMYSVGSATPIEVKMTDTDIETAKAIRLWLNMITGKPNPDPFEKAAARIMHLARKYDCAQIAASTIAVLHQVLEKSKNVFLVIEFAAVFDIPDLLAKLLRLRGNVKFSRETKVLRHAGLRGTAGPCFNPSTWELATWKTMPIEYIWALTRVRYGEGKLSEQADLFSFLIKNIKEAETLSNKRKREEESDEA